MKTEVMYTSHPVLVLSMVGLNAVWVDPPGSAQRMASLGPSPFSTAQEGRGGNANAELLSEAVATVVRNGQLSRIAQPRSRHRLCSASTECG